MSAEKNVTSLGLIDLGAFASLGDSKIVNPRSTVKKLATPTTWETKTSTLKTDKEVTMTNMNLPQFTINRRVEAKFNLFEKSEADCYSFILDGDFGQDTGWISPTA